MKYSKMTKSISTLTDDELDNILECGHIGKDTYKISELWWFYTAIEEEKKRRKI